MFELNQTELKIMEYHKNITDRSKERKERMKKRKDEIKEKIRKTLMRLGETSNKTSEEELLKTLEKLELLEKLLN